MLSLDNEVKSDGGFQDISAISAGHGSTVAISLCRSWTTPHLLDGATALLDDLDARPDLTRHGLVLSLLGGVQPPNGYEGQTRPHRTQDSSAQVHTPKKGGVRRWEGRAALIC